MSVSAPTLYREMYLGNMDIEQANLILQTRQLDVIPNLKHMIFNFPKELILRSLDEDKSIRQIIKEEDLDYTKYIGELRDYQTVGTAFMYLSPRSMIGDGVGLGKTAEIAALLNFLRSKNEMRRFIIAVENSAWSQTAVELMKFTGMYVIQLPSLSTKLKKAITKVDWNKVDGMVIKHSTLRSDVFSKWLALNMNPDGSNKIFDTFLLDESSVIKNEKTKTFTYTANMCNIARRVHFMNATSFETSIMDIYYQFDTMDPRLLPRKTKIEKEFCTFSTGTYWTKVDGKAKMNFKRDLSGYKNQAIFKNRLALFYFGRCKHDIGMDTPHQYKVFEVEPTNEQSLALSKGYRYMEVLNCPSLVPDINIKTDRKSVPKLERLMSLIENELADSQVMVYCFHTEAQKAIEQECIKIGRHPVILNGQVNDEDRFDIQTKFNSGEYDVIITNIKKSLNLYGGDACIFYSVETNPSKMEQIRGRVDRNVDDKIKTFILLIYKGTDEYRFFTNTVANRAKDSRDLTIDAKGAVDFFIEAMKEEESSELSN